MEKYYRELIQVTNLSTGKDTYFMMVCGVARRISKEDFTSYKETAIDLECLHSASSKKFRRQYTTCVYAFAPKQTRYKTAYSPEFNAYVSISDAYQDDNGKWIYVVQNEQHGLKDYLMRDCELESFCL